MNCRSCKATGKWTLDNPSAVSVPISIECPTCKGTNLVGMNREQAKWYQRQYTLLQRLRGKFIRAGEVTDEFEYQSLKRGINKSCEKLGIALLPIVHQVSRGFGSTAAYETLRFELNEYDRRLTSIPTALFNRSKVAA